MNLDALDRRILFELDRDARQSISTLARKVRQGRDKVEYRLSRLAQRQVISRCLAEIDVGKLGYSLFKTYLRLEYNKPRVQEFVHFLSRHPRLYWLAECDGSWDLILILFATDAREFYALHNEILSKFNDVVLNFSSYSMVENSIFSRNYLWANSSSVISIGSVAEQVGIDDTDREILGMLAHDARLSNSEIARKIGKSEPFAAFRIQRLEATKVIAMYRLDLNLSALGMVMFKAQLFLRNYDLKLRGQFKEYCKSHPNIVFYIEQVGDVNVEVELEVQSYEEYSRVIDEMRSKFSNLIRNFSTMLIRKVWHSPVPAKLVG